MKITTYLVTGLIIVSLGCDDGEQSVLYEGDEPSECTDGADNDRDGRFDCDDDGCAGHPECTVERADAVVPGFDAMPSADAAADATPVIDAGMTPADMERSPSPDASPAESECYLTDCLDSPPQSEQPVFGERGDGVGAGADHPCLLSPTGVFPPNRTQGWHYGAYDVSGETVVAMHGGIVRSGGGKYGSWDCYSGALCYGSLNCACEDVDGVPTVGQCEFANPVYDGGGFSYESGLRCYNHLCAPTGSCQNRDAACHNQVSIEFVSGDGDGSTYIQRVLHIGELLVEPGAQVRAGEAIATVGNTGFSCSSRMGGDGNHGHVSIYKRSGGTWSAVRWWDWLNSECDAAPQAPAFPELLAPAEGADLERGDSVEFRFERSGQAEHYFRLRFNPDNGPVIRDEAVVGDRITVADLAVGEYRWTVYFANQACVEGRCAAPAQTFYVREPVCNDPTFDTYCSGAELRRRNDCGEDQRVRECPHGCADGACSACQDPTFDRYCDGNSVRERNDCGADRHVEDCEGGCQGGVCQQPQECARGDRRRCWVQCGFELAAGCLATGAVDIMGIETCDDGRWGECVTLDECPQFAGECVNGSTAPTRYECLDGSQHRSEITCFRALGRECETSYFSGWGPGDIDDLCTGPGDRCDNVDEQRDCVVHCENPNGREVVGTQTCSRFGAIPVWGRCQVDEDQRCR